MGDPQHGGIPGWSLPSDRDDRHGRPSPYARSIGWAILAWVVAVAVVYIVAQVLGFAQLGGWLGLAGFAIGGWFGGTRGGITGTREWVLFVLALSAITFLLIGLGSCMYAIALYG